jgi:hypothetical protein
LTEPGRRVGVSHGSGSVMPIDWSSQQRRRVEAVLAEYPFASGRCVDAARNLLPTALERDAQARPWKLLPCEGWFVVPRRSLGGQRWRFHVSVKVAHHFVDALTGVDGTVKEMYLDSHWQYPESLEWVDVNLTDETL